MPPCSVVVLLRTCSLGIKFYPLPVPAVWVRTLLLSCPFLCTFRSFPLTLFLGAVLPATMCLWLILSVFAVPYSSLNLWIDIVLGLSSSTMSVPFPPFYPAGVCISTSFHSLCPSLLPTLPPSPFSALPFPFSLPTSECIDKHVYSFILSFISFQLVVFLLT